MTDSGSVSGFFGRQRSLRAQRSVCGTGSSPSVPQKQLSVDEHKLSLGSHGYAQAPFASPPAPALGLKRLNPKAHSLQRSCSEAHSDSMNAKHLLAVSTATDVRSRRNNRRPSSYAVAFRGSQQSGT
ncbi:unnamed protein product [Bursaphelenchus okinawaensis]|uniref:Uncharacterized protein n=1 Tax=Bursaphelenchus okinawaensis TaxID=465554 RepID=A0A811KC47_9BILA|nr:unnamed protein product [Bursaphelenchus okinawaensis]CAG9098354.1 unnamed protein product [Bursaphelenchus okinawaensis]